MLRFKGETPLLRDRPVEIDARAYAQGLESQLTKGDNMDYKVISADDHIDLRWLPADLWSNRLPAAMRERGPRVVDTDSGPHWQCDEVFWGAWAPYGSGQSQWALDRVPGLGSEGELRPATPDTR